jgi:flagellar FliJ protein
MTRSKRMQPVVKVAATREQEAARQLGECRRVVDEREARLAELIAYQGEYTERFQANSEGGMDMARLQDFRVFLAKLNEAIEQQRRLVERAHHDYHAKKSFWFSKRSHALAIDKVVERFEKDERRDDDRREQHDLDERSGQQHQRKREEN